MRPADYAVANTPCVASNHCCVTNASFAIVYIQSDLGRKPARGGGCVVCGRSGTSTQHLSLVHQPTVATVPIEHATRLLCILHTTHTPTLHTTHTTTLHIAHTRFTLRPFREEAPRALLLEDTNGLWSSPHCNWRGMVG